MAWEVGVEVQNSHVGHIYTSMKNHFYNMKRDIGMADYEKLVKQDFHTPSIEFHTPSLYLCFFL